MDIYLIEMECDTETMLNELAGLLVEQGYVKESYPEALIQREREYPTGLALEDNLNVAIPHADIEHAIKQVLVIVRHKSGHFLFNRMESPDNSIAVKNAFLFIITEKNRYIKFLSNFVELFRSEEGRDVIRNADLDRISEYFQEELSEYELVDKGRLDITTQIDKEARLLTRKADRD